MFMIKLISILGFFVGLTMVTACKPLDDSGSTLAVVNATEVKSEEQAQKYTPGAYGIQMVYENNSGDIKQQEATGFFTDQKGTTFITNGHVTKLKPPAGYTQKGNTRIVDFRGNTVQEITPQSESFVNPGSNRASRDLAMYKFSQGTQNLPHGSAQFAPKGYDLKTENLRLAGYGANTNSSTETPQYQTMRYGEISNKYVRNPTGDTFGYYGPRLDSDTGPSVSSAPGDSGGPIYGNSGIVGINRGGKNVDRDSSYSEAINPYGPGATSFFNEVRSRGGVVDGWDNGTTPSSQQVSQSQYSGNPAYGERALP
jgi:hypothetical protein